MLFHERELKKGIGTRLKEEQLPEVGDQMRLYVRYIQNPMGEMELSNSERERVEREDGVWREIKEHHRKGTHVKGRVLNPVNGGYAVGIAGLVCFLPNQCVRPYEGSNEPPAGELLSFKILGLTEDIKNVILMGPMTDGGNRRDAAWAGKRRGGAEGAGKDGAVAGGGFLAQESRRVEGAGDVRVEEARRRTRERRRGGGEEDDGAHGEDGGGRAADVGRGNSRKRGRRGRGGERREERLTTAMAVSQCISKSNG